MRTGHLIPEPRGGIHTGNGYINLPLALLVEAKKTDHPLWHNFRQSEHYVKGSGNCDSLSLACWIASQISSSPAHATPDTAPAPGEPPTIGAGVES